MSAALSPNELTGDVWRGGEEPGHSGGGGEASLCPRGREDAAGAQETRLLMVTPSSQSLPCQLQTDRGQRIWKWICWQWRTSISHSRARK